MTYILMSLPRNDNGITGRKEEGTDNLKGTRGNETCRRLVFGGNDFSGKGLSVTLHHKRSCVVVHSTHGSVRFKLWLTLHIHQLMKLLSYSA